MSSPEKNSPQSSTDIEPTSLDKSRLRRLVHTVVTTLQGIYDDYTPFPTPELSAERTFKSILQGIDQRASLVINDSLETLRLFTYVEPHEASRLMSTGVGYSDSKPNKKTSLIGWYLTEESHPSKNSIHENLKKFIGYLIQIRDEIPKFLQEDHIDPRLIEARMRRLFVEALEEIQAIPETTSPPVEKFARYDVFSIVIDIVFVDFPQAQAAAQIHIEHCLQAAGVTLPALKMEALNALVPQAREPYTPPNLVVQDARNTATPIPSDPPPRTPRRPIYVPGAGGVMGLQVSLDEAATIPHNEEVPYPPEISNRLEDLIAQLETIFVQELPKFHSIDSIQLQTALTELKQRIQDFITTNYSQLAVTCDASLVMGESALPSFYFKFEGSIFYYITYELNTTTHSRDIYSVAFFGPRASQVEKKLFRGDSSTPIAIPKVVHERNNRVESNLDAVETEIITTCSLLHDFCSELADYLNTHFVKTLNSEQSNLLTKTAALPYRNISENRQTVIGYILRTSKHLEQFFLKCPKAKLKLEEFVEHFKQLAPHINSPSQSNYDRIFMNYVTTIPSNLPLASKLSFFDLLQCYIEAMKYEEQLPHTINFSKAEIGYDSSNFIGLSPIWLSIK